MRQELLQEKVKVPDNVQLVLDGSTVKVVGPKGSNHRDLFYPFISLNMEDNKTLTLSAKNATRKHKRIINTFRSHINNLITGVIEGYEHKLKVCYVHFPMTVTASSTEVTVKNFLGAKLPLISKILPQVKVVVSGDVITVTGIDKESVGQTAANIEKSTVLTNRRDRRKFQDGCYITSKSGKPI